MSRAARAALAVAVLALPLATAGPSSSLDYWSTAHWAGATDLPSRGEDVALTSGFAFVVDQTDGLLVLDRSTLPPSVVTTIPTPGSARGLFLDGNTLYLADDWNGSGGEGLRIYDVSSPTAPAFLGMYPVSQADDVEAAGGVAYLLSSGQLLTLDVSTPASPSLLGSVAVIGSGLAVEDTLAFVGGSIIDVSTPATPVVLSSNSWGLAGIEDVAASGNLLYVGGAGSLGDPTGLRIIDVTDPQNPVRRSDILSDIRTMALSGSLLLATGDQVGPFGALHFGLQYVDVSDPDAPVHLATAPCKSGGSGRIAVDGNAAFVVGGGGDLDVYDHSVLASPVELASRPMVGVVRRMSTFGSLAAVTKEGYGADGLEVLDLSGATIDSLGFAAGGIQHVDLDGSLAYAVTDTDLEVFDVSSPATPTMIGSAPLTFPFETVIAYRSPFAYAAGQRLEVFDCSIPETPALVPMGALWWYAPTDLDFAGDRLCVVGASAPNQNSLGVYDATAQGPLAPLGIWSFPYVTGFPERLGVAALPDDFVAVVGSDLWIFDISDPSAPTQVASHALPGSGRSVIQGTVPGTLLVGTDAGMAIADVTDPHAPVVRGVFASTIADLALDDSGRIVLAGDGYVTVLPAGSGATEVDVSPLASSALGAFPNPSRAGVSFVLPDGGHGRRLDVFDVNGRRVWSRVLPPGASGTVRWDGQDAAGSVPAGVYFVRYRGSDGSLTRKVTLLR